jgi:hypothetical protein
MNSKDREGGSVLLLGIIMANRWFPNCGSWTLWIWVTYLKVSIRDSFSIGLEIDSPSEDCPS